MTQRTIAWLALALILIGGVAFYLWKLRQPKPPFVPVEQACAAAAVCPRTPYDVDKYGCPNGGISGDTCTVTFAYYKKFGGCTSAHEPPMMFYSHPGNGQASRLHLVAENLTTIRAFFTEIRCNNHAPLGNPGLAKPFTDNGDDFSTLKPDHTSGDADSTQAGKCFKVEVENRPGCYVDPHISIGN